jgi:hypothetical protein
MLVIPVILFYFLSLFFSPKALIKLNPSQINITGEVRVLGTVTFENLISGSVSDYLSFLPNSYVL